MVSLKRLALVLLMPACADTSDKDDTSPPDTDTDTDTPDTDTDTTVTGACLQPLSGWCTTDCPDLASYVATMRATYTSDGTSGSHRCDGDKVVVWQWSGNNPGGPDRIFDAATGELLAVVEYDPTNGFCDGTNSWRWSGVELRDCLPVRLPEAIQCYAWSSTYDWSEEACLDFEVDQADPQ